MLVQQVFINILENIAKYTPDNSLIDIGATQFPSSITLSIADQGPGIPHGTEEKIFEKFYRVTTESSQNGIGLGLALCRIIIEAHSGVINAENRPEGGAVFTITLPLHQAPQIVFDDKGEVYD